MITGINGVIGLLNSVKGIFSRTKRELPKFQNEAERKTMIGANMSFAAAEAYKLLRANIMFSFPQSDEPSCKVIGVTSSIRGEGKSISSINTAYVLALGGKRTLLIEGDLRIPTIAKRLMLRQTPGLSNVLVGMNSVSETIVVDQANPNLSVMAAGDIPPNPSELLGSEQMKQLIASLKADYDYILLDLPPVKIVADSVVVSKLCDGILVVVRQDYTDRGLLRDIIRQLEYVNAKIIGFVYNAVDSGSSRYGYGRYYKRYAKYYNYTSDAR